MTITDIEDHQVTQPATTTMVFNPSITARADTITMIWHRSITPPRAVLTEAEAPALAKIWDNDSDAIFDTM